MKIEIDKEYLKSLKFWYNAALEKSAEKSKEFYKTFIYGWSLSIYPEDNDILSIFKKAEKSKDYSAMQQLFYTHNKRILTWNLSSGYDHCMAIYTMMPYLCCADYDEIYRAFPSDLPISTNGHSMMVNATALLQCILYKGKYDEENAIAKAEKYILTKNPKWDRAYVGCFLAIIKNDADMLSENLQILCNYHTRQSICGFMKYHCQSAYGILVFAKKNLPQEIFERVKMPEHKTFDPGYMEWVFNEQFVRESIFDYKAPYEELNIVYEMPLPITKVHRPYLNSDNEYMSSSAKKAYFMDEAAMNDQVVEYVMERL